MSILANNLRHLTILLVLGLLTPTFFTSVFAESEIDSRVQASFEATAQSFEKFFAPAGNALELIFGLSTPYLILLLFPIGAYIICRSDAEDVSYWQIQKIISLGII